MMVDSADDKLAQARETLDALPLALQLAAMQGIADRADAGARAAVYLSTVTLSLLAPYMRDKIEANVRVFRLLLQDERAAGNDTTAIEITLGTLERALGHDPAMPGPRANG